MPQRCLPSPLSLWSQSRNCFFGNPTEGSSKVCSLFDAMSNLSHLPLHRCRSCLSVSFTQGFISPALNGGGSRLPRRSGCRIRVLRIASSASSSRKSFIPSLPDHLQILLPGLVNDVR